MDEFWYDNEEPKYKEKVKLKTALWSTQKLKTFKQTLQKMLKQDLILQIMNQKSFYLKKKIRKLLD